MIRFISVQNFRSLRAFTIKFADQYTCLVGENNSGKSNIITALKWLLTPESMGNQGMPAPDLSRTTTSPEVSITVGVSGGAQSDVTMDRARIIGPDGLLTFRRSFSFGGAVDAQGNVINIAAYAAPQPLEVKLYREDGTSFFRRSPELELELPRLVHIRPADIGGVSNKDDDAGSRLLRLHWPAGMRSEQVDWVNQQLDRVFRREQWQAPVRLASISEGGPLYLWDESGHALPLRRAGSAVIQVAYTLLAIAVARARANAESRLIARESVVAIDEPEQHISSATQRRYRGVLIELAKAVQVIVTSHSGLFLNRSVDGGTVVLRRGEKNGTEALPQKRNDTQAVRSCLGITVDDSLYLGEVMLLVEGPSEEAALPELLKRLFVSGRSPVNPSSVTFIRRDGASKIPQFAHLVGELGLGLVTLLDGDKAGIDAQKKMSVDAALTDATTLIIPMPAGAREAEFEDLFDEAILLSALNDYAATYKSIPPLIADDFVQAYASETFLKSKKWSDRLSTVLRRKGAIPSGKSIDDLVSKTHVTTRLLERLSCADIPRFIAVDLVQALEASLNRVRVPLHLDSVGIVPPSRNSTGLHPVYLLDTVDHDL